VEYDERMEKLRRVTHPKPLSDFIYGTFNHFRGKHPWVGGEDIKRSRSAVSCSKAT